MSYTDIPFNAEEFSAVTIYELNIEGCIKSLEKVATESANHVLESLKIGFEGTDKAIIASFLR